MSRKYFCLFVKAEFMLPKASKNNCNKPEQFPKQAKKKNTVLPSNSVPTFQGNKRL